MSAAPKLTDAQRIALRFAARVNLAEVDGVHPRRGQSQMFERLRLMGMLTDAGAGVSDDNHEREVQLYQITDAGRAAIGEGR